MRTVAKTPCILLIILITALASSAQAGDAGMKKWQKGKGWGWVWGPEDEVGSLNEMTQASKRAALSLAKTGKTYDLGIVYDRDSFKWPGHSPGRDHDLSLPRGGKAPG